VSKYGRLKYDNIGFLMIQFARTIALMVEKNYISFGDVQKMGLK